MAQHETQARSVLAFMRSNPRLLLLESFHRVTPSYPETEGPRHRALAPLDYGQANDKL